MAGYADLYLSLKQGCREAAEQFIFPDTESPLCARCWVLGHSVAGAETVTSPGTPRHMGPAGGAELDGIEGFPEDTRRLS